MPKGQKGVLNPAYKHGHTGGGVFSPTYEGAILKALDDLCKKEKK